MIPRIAIRTISFEKVLLELNVIRFAMKRGKFNPKWFFCTFSKDAFFLISFMIQLPGTLNKYF
jgi:hypothetical protein